MRHKIGLVLATVIFSVLISSYAIFAQEASGPATPAQEPAVTQTQPPAEPETQWVWGEVVSVDPQKNELTVKCFDYEIEQEKEMKISADNQTTYENVKSLSEIKTKDTLSIDYVVSADGKNIAENISIEKPESASPPVTEEEVTPAQPEAKTESQAPEPAATEQAPATPEAAGPSGQ